MNAKWSAIPLTLLIFFLSVTPVESLQQSINAMSFHGKVASLTDDVNNASLPGPWWGVVAGSTAWGDDTPGGEYGWGNVIGKPQIDTVANAGATSIRIMLDKYAWDTNNTQNTMHKPYKDYVRTLVQICHNAHMKALLDLCRDSGTSWGDDFDIYGKDEVITNAVKRADWMSWGDEVIAYCEPDAIGIMNEPRGGGTTFDYYYANFVLPSITAYQATAVGVGISDFKIFVMGYPFYDPHLFTGAYTITDKNVIIDYHCYFNPSSCFSPSISGGSPLFDSMCAAFYNGDVTEGTKMLQEYLDGQLVGLDLSRVNLAEVGVFRTKGHYWSNDPSTEYLGWQGFMKALYDYVKNNGLQGLHQYQLAGSIYTMLDGSDYTIFTPYGKVWVDNVPQLAI